MWNRSHFHFPFLVLYFLAELFAALSGEHAGLYSSGDSVIALSGDDFYSHLLYKDNVWIIEFYNTWCGHCVNFAPTYKRFAENIKGWSRVVRVAAIDCSQEKNIGICRKYDIYAYPSMILFPPYEGLTGKGYMLEGGRQLDDLLHTVIEFVSNRQHFQPPRSWPYLQPLSRIEGIWQRAPRGVEYVFLIFEKHNSITGREVILDTMNETNILVKRLTERGSHTYGIRQVPSLYSLSREGYLTRHMVGHGVENDRSLFVNAMKEKSRVRWRQTVPTTTITTRPTTTKVTARVGYIPGYGNTSVTTVSAYIETTTELPIEVVNVSVVHMQDIESGLSYLFRQEVAIHRTMSPVALDALKKFVLVLAKSLPVRKPISNFLWKVSNWLQGVHGGLTGEQWSRQIERLQTNDSFLPNTIIWTGCHGSKLKFRGYPCSMWTIFHTLTVNAYLKASFSREYHQPLEVLSAVRGYMTNFFGCAECAKNFNKMAVTIPQEVRYLTDSVLWLWRAHNKANKRLHGEPSEDPLYPKIQFPSKSMCPRCHQAGSTDVNPIWNRFQVFYFIANMYRRENIVQDVSENSMGHARRAKAFRAAARSESELDWWEIEQRKKDMHAIQEIRNKKMNKIQTGKAQRLTNGSNIRHMLSMLVLLSSFHFVMLV